ncbi:sugar ABC transporter ATP-binding protein [Erysipelothrix urinaevulpis]|uniref:sugar ABC transporter ATP-binding protein n=1 Tax=Erysipelothrix urinaevulpis TaxID=2683717 RepID=UPI00191554AB|nr:sugar ABC transporter ATP-binding protein [Erysipelothrix urinaevulpis]
MILEAKNITKEFPGVMALDNVECTFKKGSIHAIIGENGAGKSTLIKCLTNVYQPNDGTITIDGKDVSTNPQLFNKIAYVPQELDLFEEMTVMENLFMPFERSGFSGLINNQELKRTARPILEKYKIDVKPEQLVSSLSISQKQLLQIARAMIQKDYEIILLDEPTTSLTSKDTEHLFEIIKELAKNGKSVVFISHKLDEIMQISDDILVLRDGKVSNYDAVEKVNHDWIITSMTGRSIDNEQVYISRKTSEDLLFKCTNLAGVGFSNVNLELFKGEILGLYGLVGSGRSETMQALLGSKPIVQGHAEIEEKPMSSSVKENIKNGFVYIPEERKQQAIFENLSVRENASLAYLDDIIDKRQVNSKKEVVEINKIIAEYNVKTPSYDQKIKFLSGGNQQKVIIGRAMNTKPKILVLDEPTKGIDIGTKNEIYQMMKELAESGVGIILISSELDELIKCSNRIVTFYDGKTISSFNHGVSKEKIISSILGREENENINK